MGQLLVRGLGDWLVQALRDRAARAGRSVEAEHRAILEQVLGPESGGFADRAARLRAETPLQRTDAAELLRRDRARNAAPP